MNPIVRRALRNGFILGLFVCLAWSVIACGNGDDQRTEPNQDSRIVAATVEAILDARATAEAEAAPTATVPSLISSGWAGKSIQSAWGTVINFIRLGRQVPVPTAQPSPTPIAAPVVSPTQDSTQEVGGAGTDGGDPGSTEPLAPLAAEDADAFLADVSDSERMCLSDNIPSDRVAMLATTPELATEVERETFLGCLEHNTLLRLLLTPVLSATGPLSVESSACMRSSYADTDLAALMSSVVADPGTGPEAEAAMAQGMVMFFVSLSCLNEEEFQTGSVAMGLAPGERENFLCVLDQVGGQEALAALLIPSAEFPAELFQAAFGCQFQMGGPPPG